MAKLPGAIQGARIVGEHFVRSQRQENPEGRMPLMDHIRELRNRVVKMALALGAGMIVAMTAGVTAGAADAAAGPVSELASV